MAYKLELPPIARLHPVFHVSCLKPFHEGSIPAVPTLPTDLTEVFLPQPLAILDHRIHGRTLEVLVLWQHTSPAEASWEPVSHMQQHYPEFLLEDKHQLEGRSNVSKPVTHGKHKKG